MESREELCRVGGEGAQMRREVIASTLHTSLMAINLWCAAHGGLQGRCRKLTIALHVE